jgi:hypothetical protein
MLAIGVQMETIVMTPPGRADVIGLLEYSYVELRRAHRSGTCKPGRACANDDRVEIPQHVLREQD